MTPAARYAAAIDVLDHAAEGQPAEKALTAWGRANRYAGSKDRAAVRDHVYDVLRQKRSFAHVGGGTTGRCLILGLLRSQEIDPAGIFGAGGYGPTELEAHEAQAIMAPMLDAVALDLPDWLWPVWDADLGAAAKDVALVQKSRAPIALRVNLRRGSLVEVQSALAEDDIETNAVPASQTTLLVVKNARRIKQSQAFLTGLCDLQDLSSQQAVAGLNMPNGARVLDYCAGGGGKALAIADMHDARVFAHDIAPERTVDIPPRAARAGVEITPVLTMNLDGEDLFDLVFCDAPCSGSGTWRRTPEAKWALTPQKLMNYTALQIEVIANAADYIGPNGQLVYATCSVLQAENAVVVAAFLRAHPGWTCISQNMRLPNEFGDGFFHAVLQKE